MTPQGPKRRWHFHPELQDVIVTPFYANALGKTIENFECVHCKFATIDIKPMKEHQWHGEHPWPWPQGCHPILIREGLAEPVQDEGPETPLDQEEYHEYCEDSTGHTP